jgi:hypothetical protein
MLRELKVESEKAGMRLNLKKTKIMTTGNLNKFKLGGTEIEIIDSYTFLGMIITTDGSMSKEINRRISSRRLAIIKLEKIMKDRDMTATTKSENSRNDDIPNSDLWKRELDVEKEERKKK